MSRFRKVAAGTWGDERFRSLSEPAQRLWLYLLTGNEVTSLPGLLVIGRAGLAEALDWTLPKLDRCFKELSLAKNEDGIPMAKADWRARVVWLPKGYKHNAPANPNVVRGWKDLWRSVPECELKAEALIVLRGFMIKMGEAFAKTFTEVIDTYESVRARHGLQPGADTTITSGTVPHLVPPLSTQTSLEPSLARARAAPAPSTAPAADTSRVPLPERVVDLGTARCQAACDAFVGALAESGWTRGEVREPWERRALCDAINAHLRADGTVAGVLAELRRAVGDWTAAKADGARFTSGWGARKFADWLAEGREAATGVRAVVPASEARAIASPVEPEREYTPEEIAAIDARVAESVERLQNAHRMPSPRPHRGPAPASSGDLYEQTPAEREAARQRQLAALAAITAGEPSRVA